MFFTSCYSTRKVIEKEKEQKVQDVRLDSSEAFSFPEDWLGYWEGNLNIYDSQGLKQTIPMALDNHKTDSIGVYGWAIIYGEDTIQGKRDYILNTVDKSAGHYQVDEQNGILLDSYIIENELISVFSVMNNTLTTVYRRESDRMIFNILMYESNHSSITGDTIINKEEIPAVKNYKPRITQKAILKRRKG